MDFEVIGSVRDIETIARGSGVRIRSYLWHRYGRGNWRKMKGIAQVMYPDGSVWLVELYWFEAHGIGRKDARIKRVLHQL